MVTGLHTIIVQTTNMDRSVAFYRDVLGLKPGYTSPYWSDFDMGGTRLGLHPAMVEPPVGTPKHGAIVGVAAADILGLWSKLKASGVWTGEALHDTPSGAIIDFADPDGNAFQAIEPGKKIADLAS